ncbi:MAG: hypothetical protein ABW321_33365 [Polyangiales bacterium]
MDIRTIAELTIAQSPERVFHALREPSAIRRWFGWEHAGLDDEIQFIFQTDAEVIEGGRVRFKGIDTTFSVDDHGPGSVLRVTTPGPDLGYDEVAEGFISFTQQLRFLLERHPDEDRKTLFLPTPARTPIERARVARGKPIFGTFAALASVPVGAPYELSAAEPLQGEIWFRTAHQLGVTFDHGHALLILSRPPEQPHGTAILTSFNDDDAAWTAQRERWLAFWKAECS